MVRYLSVGSNDNEVGSGIGRYGVPGAYQGRFTAPLSEIDTGVKQ